MNHALRIAVADDEPLMLRWYERVLGKLGHVVCVLARDGRELVEKCRAAHPDLIITDIRMPRVNGFEAIAALRAEMPVDVILVSAYHDRLYSEEASRHEVSEYLVLLYELSRIDAVVTSSARGQLPSSGMPMVDARFLVTPQDGRDPGCDLLGCREATL
jgi:DNA-binding NarL/FixJ family response regulator